MSSGRNEEEGCQERHFNHQRHHKTSNYSHVTRRVSLTRLGSCLCGLHMPKIQALKDQKFNFLWVINSPPSIESPVDPIFPKSSQTFCTSAIGSFGFQRFYNLGNLEKARKNLETRLAGNSSPFSRKLISETIYRNLQNL